MNIRKVKLVGGPMDGTFSMASHQTVQTAGGPYVYDGGGDPDQFQHAKTLVKSIPKDQRKMEREMVQAWINAPKVPSGIKGPNGEDIMLPAPMSMCLGIPPWRINAWVQVLNPGWPSVGNEKQ